LKKKGIPGPFTPGKIMRCRGKKGKKLTPRGKTLSQNARGKREAAKKGKWDNSGKRGTSGKNRAREYKVHTKERGRGRKKRTKTLSKKEKRSLQESRWRTGHERKKGGHKCQGGR